MSVKKVKLLQDVIGDRGREGIAGGGVMQGHRERVLDREKQEVLTVPRGLTQLPMGAALDACCCCCRSVYSCEGGGEEGGE